MNTKTLLEILGTVLTLLAVFLLGEQVMLAGFLIGAIANIIWIFWGLGVVTGAFYVLQLGMLIINIRGLFYV